MRFVRRLSRFDRLLLAMLMHLTIQYAIALFSFSVSTLTTEIEFKSICAAKLEQNKSSTRPLS